jgi:hypothetical protein
LIDFQIDGFIKGKKFSDEVDRIYKQGRYVPQVWMKGAVGNPIAVEPMLKAVDEALKVIN